MDQLETYRDIVESVLTEYSRIPYAHGDIQSEVVFDRNRDRYLLMNVGWRDDRRIHGCLVHIDIIGDKLWVQRDGTEQGIANELVQTGISKDHIVLGFRAPEVRQYTNFAVA